jgi:hypothetical protein
MSTAPDQAKDRKLQKDLRILAKFIQIYCRDLHKDAPKRPMQLKTHDVSAIARGEVILCPECAKLLAHAFIKRTHCPMDPKPMCKHCPQHCYQPSYRTQMQEVMRHSGRKMIYGGRLDYLLHYLF